MKFIKSTTNSYQINNNALISDSHTEHTYKIPTRIRTPHYPLMIIPPKLKSIPPPLPRISDEISCDDFLALAS